MTVAAAEHSTRKRPGMLIFFDQYFTVHDRHLDAGRFLDKALLIARQILHHLRISLANG